MRRMEARRKLPRSKSSRMPPRREKLRVSPRLVMEMKGRRMPKVRAARAKRVRTAALRLFFNLGRRGWREAPQWGQEGRNNFAGGRERALWQRRQMRNLSVVSGPLSVAI